MPPRIQNSVCLSQQKSCKSIPLSIEINYKLKFIINKLQENIIITWNIFQDGSVEINALTKGSRNFNPMVLLIPACCDIISTSVMYVGLNLTYASSFQMLRGAVIVFTGILSVGFLNKKLVTREWSGIALVIAGLAIVGGSDLVKNNDSDVSVNSILTGDLLILCAQVIIFFIPFDFTLI